MKNHGLLLIGLAVILHELFSFGIKILLIEKMTIKGSFPIENCDFQSYHEILCDFCSNYILLGISVFRIFEWKTTLFCILQENV